MHEITLDSAGPGARGRVARVVADKLKLVLLAITVVLLVKTFLLDIVVVQGGSMEPALCSGDYVLVEKLSPRLGLLKPGQVVVLAAGAPQALMVKRIVATGGDEVELRPGQVIVNGSSSARERHAATRNQRRARILVPPGQLFVLGDNGARSNDSEDFGPVPAANVRARVIAGLAQWAGAGSSGITVFTCAAGSEGAGARLGSRGTVGRIIAAARAAMADVKAAHVVAGDEQIWISEDYGVRRETGHGFAVYTDEGTWHYDRRHNKVVVSPREPHAAWAHLQQLSGYHWLPAPGQEGSAFQPSAVSADVLDGKATHRLETNPGPDGEGATLWIDNRSMRVVGYEHWRLHGATREAIGPRARLAYDTPIRPELFIAKTPGGAVTVDLRTGGDS